jgi:hypothetical protein
MGSAKGLGLNRHPDHLAISPVSRDTLYVTPWALAVTLSTWHCTSELCLWSIKLAAPAASGWADS